MVVLLIVLIGRNGPKNVIGSTMHELLQEFKNEVIKVAGELEDSGVFKNSHELPTHQHIFLQEVLEEKLADWRWPDALFELTELLHTLHKRKVVCSSGR